MAERKILQLSLVTETYPPEINGVANTLRNLVGILEQRGHRIHLIRPRQKEEVSASAHSKRHVTLVPGLPIPKYQGLRFGLPVYRRLLRLWRETRPDAVYIATQGPLGHAALSAARAIDIPALTGFHTRFHEYSAHYGFGVLSHWIVTALRRFHKRASATLVPTERLRAELLTLGFERVHVLGRGVDTKLFDPRRRSEKLRCSWGCPDKGLVVLYVGRLAAEKNLSLVLQTFDDIASSFSDARLVLVGDGPQLGHLRQAYPHLALTGAKVGVELAEHYASGDLFLFPSLTETFGNVVPEAMASGLSVVAFDYGAAGLCIHNGHDGVKVPMGDASAFREAAMAAVGNPLALRTMGEAARATAEGMNWGRVTEDLEKLLYELIDRQRTEDRHETLAATTK